MIASVDRIDLFLKKHQHRDDCGGLPLWNLAHRKSENADRINRLIASRDWRFGERTDRALSNGKRVSFYREWEDRFVEFCLYRHLTDLAVSKGEVSRGTCRSGDGGVSTPSGNCSAICPIIRTCSRRTSNHTTKASTSPCWNPSSTARVFPAPCTTWFCGICLRRRADQAQGDIPGKRHVLPLRRVYLEELDVSLSRIEGVRYQQYRDDILILSKDRESLEKCRDILYAVLRKRMLKTRYGKTFSGSSSAPLSWLGFVVSPGKGRRKEPGIPPEGRIGSLFRGGQKVLPRRGHTKGPRRTGKTIIFFKILAKILKFTTTRRYNVD